MDENLKAFNSKSFLKPFRKLFKVVYRMMRLDVHNSLSNRFCVLLKLPTALFLAIAFYLFFFIVNRREDPFLVVLDFVFMDMGHIHFSFIVGFACCLYRFKVDGSTTFNRVVLSCHLCFFKPRRARQL